MSPHEKQAIADKAEKAAQKEARKRVLQTQLTSIELPNDKLSVIPSVPAAVSMKSIAKPP